MQQGLDEVVEDGALAVAQVYLSDGFRYLWRSVAGD